MRPMSFAMRALANPGPGYVAWTSIRPDFSGADAPAAIQAGTAVVVSGSGRSKSFIDKLDTTHSPAGLWLFDGNLNDSSGNLVHLLGGTPRGYTDAAKDRVRGVVFEATRLTRGYNPLLVLPGDLTIEVVGVFQSKVSAVQSIICYGYTGETQTNNRLYDFRIGTAGGLSLFWESGAGVNRSTVSADNVVPVGVPTHLAVSRGTSGASSVSRFFVDGEFVGESSATTADGGDSVNCTLSIGDQSENPGTTLCQPGTIFYCVKLIASCLTDDQIKAEYNRVLGGQCLGWDRRA